MTSDRGLHCLPMTLFWVSRQERINGISASYNGEIKTIIMITNKNNNNNNNKYNIYLHACNQDVLIFNKKLS